MKRTRHGEEGKPQLRDTNHYLALMEKTIRKLAYRHSVYAVFDDFLEMSAISLSNAVDLSQRKAREERYMKLVQRYTKEEMQEFPSLLGMLAMALEGELSDVLGVLYHRLEMHNKHAGQFFTPYVVCMAMAQMLMHDAKHFVQEKGFIRAQEPCVGSGAMVIALAQACKDVGVHYQRELHVTAIDLDATAVHMAYVQFFLLHIPAVVIYGDTLRGEEYAHWHTAAHILNLWEWKLRRAEQEKQEAMVEDVVPAPVVEVSEPPVCAKVPPSVPVSTPVGVQLTLF